MINGVAKSVNQNFIKIITNNDPEEVSNIIYKNKDGVKLKLQPYNPQ